jgi:hypothetical protein
MGAGQCHTFTNALTFQLQDLADLPMMLDSSTKHKRGGEDQGTEKKKGTYKVNQNQNKKRARKV